MLPLAVRRLPGCPKVPSLTRCFPVTSQVRCKHDRSIFDQNYAIDPSSLPWIDIEAAPGMQFKPLRSSRETGMFSAIMRLKEGAQQPNMVYFGSSDFLVLDGQLEYEDGYMKGQLGAGTWGYIPANSRLDGTISPSADTEYLQNFMGAVGFLSSNGKDIMGLLTGRDMINAASDKGINLVPSTHHESASLSASPLAYHGKDAEPLASFKKGFAKIASDTNLVGSDDDSYIKPHYINTNALPWVPTPGAPDVKVKILRVSEETGTTNMIVSQQAVVPEHQHMGPSDFIVLEGTMGLVGGRDQGYGPGMWIYEDAGARHEGTYQKSEEDLVYLANIYGPVCFDSGPGTPIAVVASFMDYVDIAESTGQPLVRNIFPDDSTLLVQQPAM